MRTFWYIDLKGEWETFECVDDGYNKKLAEWIE